MTGTPIAEFFISFILFPFYIPMSSIQYFRGAIEIVQEDRGWFDSTSDWSFSYPLAVVDISFHHLAIPVVMVNEVEVALIIECGFARK